MTHLNIEVFPTSTVSGLRQKIKMLTTMIEKSKFKGQKEKTAKQNLAWYRHKLKNMSGKKPARKKIPARKKRK